MTVVIQRVVFSASSDVTLVCDDDTLIEAHNLPGLIYQIVIRLIRSLLTVRQCFIICVGFFFYFQENKKDPNLSMDSSCQARPSTAAEFCD